MENWSSARFVRLKSKKRGKPRMPGKLEKLEVRLIVRPKRERSPAYDALWRWLLGPAQDRTTAKVNQQPTEGEGDSGELMNHQ